MNELDEKKQTLINRCWDEVVRASKALHTLPLTDASARLDASEAIKHLTETAIALEQNLRSRATSQRCRCPEVQYDIGDRVAFVERPKIFTEDQWGPERQGVVLEMHPSRFKDMPPSYVIQPDGTGDGIQSRVVAKQQYMRHVKKEQ